MNLKKMALLAGMALAALALAIPATASAEPLTWTDRHVHLGNEEVTEPKPFEGFLKFALVGAEENNFGCQVTVKIVAEGPNKGTVTEFAPTTSTCVGEGAFTNCVLEKDKTNIAEGWHVEVTANGLTHITSTSGDITFHREYKAGSCASGITTSHLEFGSATVTPTMDGLEGKEGTITHLHVHAVTTDGSVTESGSLTPEGEKTLGLAT